MDPENLYIVAVNYLAHAYLSFGNAEIAVGNLISDFVKGKKKFDYPPVIQQGIALHRAIDSFTDSHPVTRQATAFFKADYGLYGGPLVDVIYDHFLANDPIRFPTAGNTSPVQTNDPAHPPTPGEPSPIISPTAGDDSSPVYPAAASISPIFPTAERHSSPTLAAFAETTYQQISSLQAVFPERFARLFPYMRTQNWLYNYRYKQGIFNSFRGLHQRASYMPDPEKACRLFETHYSGLNACYTAFFPALHDFAAMTLRQLTGTPGSGKIE